MRLLPYGAGAFARVEMWSHRPICLSITPAWGELSSTQWESPMDLKHWYRCKVCGYMYTPQQVQALVHLLASRSEATPAEFTEPIPCRKKGCDGTLVLTDDPYRDARS